jgi:uncharacterized phage-associated protein
MANVFELAKLILTSTGGTVSGKKLQKLVYYCQAWHVTALDRPLLSDATEAWLHGPVVPQLWGRHRYALSVSADDFDVPLPALDEDSAACVKAVVAHYSRFNGHQLESMTHDEAPWKNVFEANQNHQITTESMRRFYSGVIARNEPRPSLKKLAYSYVEVSEYSEIESDLEDATPAPGLVALLKKAHSG